MNIITDTHVDEEGSTCFGYHSGYQSPSPPEVQLRILSESLGNFLGYEKSLITPESPKNSEGWFIIPKWQCCAKTYPEAVNRVRKALGSTRDGKVYHYFGHNGLTDSRLRHSSKTAKAFDRLHQEQPDHDLLVVPAQFGLHHHGRSIRRAQEIMRENEFGLGAFEVGIMLLTHANRLNCCNDLWIDCAGDEYDDPDDELRFNRAPVFRFNDQNLRFDSRPRDEAYALYGSASGFLP